MAAAGGDSGQGGTCGVTVDDMLQDLAARIGRVSTPHPVRVAIDGIDAAGKTTLADALARRMDRTGRTIIRASIDGFHRPRSDRYARGGDTPLGYYEDSFDYDRLVDLLLAPLSQDPPGCFRRRAFDYRTDAPVDAEAEVCPRNAVLLFDGVFLFRPAVNAWWDYRIFLDASFEVALQRAVARDAGRMGGDVAAQRRYRQRYYPGQRLYFDRVDPKRLADIVIQNDDPAAPRLIEARKG